MHRWPYEWYQESIVKPKSIVNPYPFGYPRSIEASGTLPSHNPKGLFKRGALCTLEDTSSNCLPAFNLALTTLKFLPQEVVSTSSSLIKNIYKSSTGLVSDAANGVISLFSGSPVWVRLELDLPEAISGLQFDYQFGGTGEGLLTVYLDDQRVYAADQRNGSGMKRSTGPFAVGAISPGQHFLSFRLDNFDGPPSSMDLSAIALGSFELEPVSNQSPVSAAGDYRTVRVKSNVSLDGSGSHDPEDAVLSYQWWQVDGAAVTLTSPIAKHPLFVPPLPGQYVFNLSVNDGQSDSFASSIVISVPSLGDIDLDRDVDNNDLNLVLAARNKPASGPNDLRDLDGNMKLDALDARKLTTLCTRPGCATQ